MKNIVLINIAGFVLKMTSLQCVLVLTGGDILAPVFLFSNFAHETHLSIQKSVCRGVCNSSPGAHSHPQPLVLLLLPMAVRGAALLPPAGPMQASVLS